MARRLLPGLFAALIIAGALYLSGLRRGEAQSPPALVTAGELTPISVAENGQSVNNGYPDLMRDHQGNLWCAWISARQRDPEVKQQNAPYEEGDMVVLRAAKQGQWGRAIILNTNFGVNFKPVLGEDSQGNIIAVWSSRREGVDGIWWRRVSPDLALGSELRVPQAGSLEANPALARAADGSLYLAFQSYRNGSSDIVFYRLEGSGWQRLADPAATPDPEFRPRLAAARDGAVWCAWDVYSDGKYRVMVRRYDPASASWAAAEHAPGDGSLDAYAPDVAVDSAGRVWVTYARNEAQEHAWGLRGPKSGPSPRPTTRLVVRDGSGWAYPEPLGRPDPGHVAEGDLPRIAIDAQDAVWVVWQRLPAHVDWKVGAAVYQGGQWLASSRVWSRRAGGSGRAAAPRRPAGLNRHLGPGARSVGL